MDKEAVFGPAGGIAAASKSPAWKGTGTRNRRGVVGIGGIGGIGGTGGTGGMGSFQQS